MYTSELEFLVHVLSPFGGKGQVWKKIIQQLESLHSFLFNIWMYLLMLIINFKLLVNQLKRCKYYKFISKNWRVGCCSPTHLQDLFSFS
jgi:hypothetical protein